MNNLEEYHNWLIEKGRAKTTIRQYLIYMRKIPQDERERERFIRENIRNYNLIAAWRNYLEFLEEKDYITTEELFKLKRRYPPPKRRGVDREGIALPRKDWPKLIKAGHHAHARMAFFLLLKTALRNSELRHLRIQDVDLNKKVLKIREHKPILKEGQLAWNPKRFKSREVPFDDDVAETLRDWLKNRPNLSHPYILWNPDPRAKVGPIGIRALQSWVKKARKDIQIRDLRRTCLTDALYRTNNPRVPQLIAGHDSLTTTTSYIGQDKAKAFDLFRNMS